MDKNINIRVSGTTHSHLTRLANKNESYDHVVTKLIQEHLIQHEILPAIAKIRTICGDELIMEDGNQILPSTEVQAKIQSILADEIGFDYGIHPEWDISQVIETAIDEDFVGSAPWSGDRNLPLSEVAVNVYCLYLEMPSPTTGLGAMITPFKEFEL